MNVEYVTSKHVPIADCLSRLVNSNSAQEDDTLNLQIADLGVEPVWIDWQNIRRFTMILSHFGMTCQDHTTQMA